jgi:hypothetical protein
MKIFFAISVVLLLAMVGIRFWLDRERAAERTRFDNASQVYKAREADLLKSRAQAMEAITKIVPAHGAKATAPQASPASSPKETPTPDSVIASPDSNPPK